MALCIQDVVKRIPRKGGIKLSELADGLAVSERTVRRHINQANQSMIGIASIAFNQDYGYCISVTDEAAFRSFLRGTVRSECLSRGYRVTLLLSNLLSRTDWVTIDCLAEQLCVSRRTASSDLREVEGCLEKYDLTLVSKPYHGIRVEGTEVAKRLCLANTVFEQFLNGSEEPVTACPSRGQESGCEVTIEAISQCVSEALENETVRIGSEAYQNLFIHIAIAIVRIRNKMYVPLEDEGLLLFENSAEHVCAERIARALEARFNVELPESEVSYIALHLAGKRLTLRSESASQPVTESIPDEIWDVVERMLGMVLNAFSIDLRCDLELRTNLARHLGPLAVRLRYGMMVDNPLLVEIKARFPLAWAIAADASHALQDVYGVLPDENEIGYIALAFALALERKGEEPEKKRVLVVCASGAGTARLLAHRCRQEFSAHVEAVETCDVSQLGAIDFDEFDYVLTTVEIPENVHVPIPVRKIGAFLDSQDVSSVLEMFHQTEMAGLVRYFPPNLFCAHLQEQTRESVLEHMVSVVERRWEVPESFRSLVLERERMGPTSFGNQVALPHPARAIGGPPFVAVGLLDQPVVWDGHDVRAVFLISFSCDDSVDIDEFNKGIAALLSDGKAIRSLLDDQRYCVLRELLQTSDSY